MFYVYRIEVQMKRAGITINFLVLLLLSGGCNDYKKLNGEAKKEKKQDKISLQFRILQILQAEEKCHSPGAVYIKDANEIYLILYGIRTCKTNPLPTGLIRNSKTRELIQTESIPYSSGIILSCDCQKDLSGNGNWYKSPVADPVNGQLLEYLTWESEYIAYRHGDVLYCIASCDRTTYHQKIVID